MAPYKFTKAVIEGKPIDVYGDGSTLRDYTFIDDIVKGIIAAADKDLRHEIINLGNSNPVSLSDFIATIEKVTGKSAIINRKSAQPGDVAKTYADIAKAKAILGWEPKTKIEEGLRETYLWLSNSCREAQL
jgi:UDP-glucuronate 4-epimerase